MENDMDLRTPIEGMLRSLGFEVFGTDNGKHAVMMQFQQHFDLMFLHWNNKELRGDKVLEAMILLCDRIPKTIIISGQDGSSFHCSADISGFLFKPFSYDRMIKAVWDALEKE